MRKWKIESLTARQLRGVHLGGIWSCQPPNTCLDPCALWLHAYNPWSNSVDLSWTRPHIVGFFWLRRLKQEVLALMFLLILNMAPIPRVMSGLLLVTSGQPSFLGHGPWSGAQSLEAEALNLVSRPGTLLVASWCLSVLTLPPIHLLLDFSTEGIFCQAYLANLSDYDDKPQMWSYLFVSVLGFFFVIVFPVCFVEISLA